MDEMNVTYADDSEEIFPDDGYNSIKISDDVP